MSKKTKVIIGCVIALVVGLAIHEELGHQVRAMQASAPGTQADLFTKLQSLVAMAIAACGGMGAIVAFFHKFAEDLPDGKLKRGMLAVVDATEFDTYATQYKATTDQSEKTALREAIMIRVTNWANAKFPPVKTGANQ